MQKTIKEYIVEKDDLLEMFNSQLHIAALKASGIDVDLISFNKITEEELSEYYCIYD